MELLFCSPVETLSYSGIAPNQKLGSSSSDSQVSFKGICFGRVAVPWIGGLKGLKSTRIQIWVGEAPPLDTPVALTLEGRTVVKRGVGEPLSWLPFQPILSNNGGVLSKEPGPAGKGSSPFCIPAVVLVLSLLHLPSSTFIFFFLSSLLSLLETDRLLDHRVCLLCLPPAGAGPTRWGEEGGWQAAGWPVHSWSRCCCLQLLTSLASMGSFAPGAAAQELLLPQDWDRAQFFTAVHWIQAVTATLSIMGSSSIIGYTIFQNTTRSPEVRPLVYLSLSDLFLGLCWLTGALFYSTKASHPAREGTICYNLQATGQIFYVASFLYTVNYTWQLYVDLKGKFNQHLHGQMPQMLNYSTHLGRIAILFSSLIPIFLMAPVLGLGNHFQCSQNFTAEHGCLLLHMENMLSPRSQHVTCTVLCLYSTGVFLVSFMVSFLAILTLLIRARMLYKRFVNSMGYVGDQQWAMLKVVEQAVALYPVVFFCCWGPAFILGIVKLARIDNAGIYMALYVLEALTASSQGFLNCVVYGWTQHMFHCVKREACRDVDTQTPLLRSQKRFYASTLPAHPQAVAEPSSPSTTTVL